VARSKISEVYDAFASLPITIGDNDIICFEPSKIPNTITTAHLPLRMLSPISRFTQQFANASNVFNVGLGGTVNQIFWTITDLFLYQPISQNIGIKAKNDVLIEYCTDYFEKLASGALELPDNIWIENVVMRPDVIEFPLLSSNFFVGVVGLFTISEKIP
jgi:hypothetical protein